eukprot:CAMPEP_0182857042 /NCGR_PEP_ID=MMETSP0034_2-20130328/2812_1 /TAXON_ID=156128 /ORGANISM="Nephroselmis pyriformis, Strain CCMP717" /LENGTH=78 /DNA_ID=CAMNT_0024988225 /DNA_START=219 /DNA_END=455 /DNA_ORIENTATION=-
MTNWRLDLTKRLPMRVAMGAGAAGFSDLVLLMEDCESVLTARAPMRGAPSGLRLASACADTDEKIFISPLALGVGPER